MWLDPEAKLLPLCVTKAGCPIEDLATDETLLEDCLTFLTAKHLFLRTQDPTVQRAAFEALGLYEKPELHLQLESIWSVWLENERARAANDR